MGKDKEMKIPNKIRIGGQDIDVLIKDHLTEEKLGTICLASGELEIAEKFYDSKQSESSKVNTFIHEVVHGVLNTMGENKLSSDEKFVSTFASLLVDVFEETIKANKEECANDKSE